MASRRSAGRGRRSFGLLAQQVVEVERLGIHRQLAARLARPLLLRAVPGELEAVAVGVAQVERLGDAVVAGALERVAGGEQAAQRVGD